MVGLQTLNLAIGVRVPASQPTKFPAGSATCNLNQLFCRSGNLLVPIDSGKLLVLIRPPSQWPLGKSGSAYGTRTVISALQAFLSF
jgi:hypothetical protein